MDTIKILHDVDFDRLYIENRIKGTRIGDESTDYSSFEFRHGYGTLYKAGASVGKGVTAKVKVDLCVSTFTEDSYEVTTNEMKNVLDSSITEHLRETTSQSNHADWWFWLFSNSSSDYQHHKDAHTETVNTTDTTVSNSIKKNFSNNKQDYHITGEFEIVGESVIPTTAYLFVEMLQITTKDGNTTTVINSSPIAADANGDTSKVSTDPSQKLNILPL